MFQLLKKKMKYQTRLHSIDPLPTQNIHVKMKKCDPPRELNQAILQI